MMPFFKKTIRPHTARSVQSWFEEHEDALQHLWLVQSPNLNIIKLLVSFREQGAKHIPSIINQATRRRVVQYFARDCSKHTGCVTRHWWPNSILTLILLTWRIWWANNASKWQMGFNSAFKGLIKKYVYFFYSCFHYFCPSPVHAAKLYSLGWLDKLCIFVSRCFVYSLPCLSVFSNAVEWFCFVNLFSS